MHISELILFQQPPQYICKRTYQKPFSFRKTFNEKKQITSHLNNQKIGCYLNFLKQKTQLALRSKSKSNKHTSLTKRQLLASRINFQVLQVKSKRIYVDKRKPNKLNLSKITIGELAQMPQIPKQRQYRHLMSLTSREFNNNKYVQSDTLKFQRLTNNSSRLSVWNQNIFHYTLSPISKQKPFNKKRKWSNMSGSYEVQCLKL